MASAGRVTGIGGVFVVSPDPAALAHWYRDALGLDVADWGGAALRTDARGYPATAVWMAFRPGAEQIGPSTREFMINLAVDDLDAVIARLAGMGIEPIAREEGDPHGRFAWVLDPDGTKVELWQPR